MKPNLRSNVGTAVSISLAVLLAVVLLLNLLAASQLGWGYLLLISVIMLLALGNAMLTLKNLRQPKTKPSSSHIKQSTSQPSSPPDTTPSPRIASSRTSDTNTFPAPDDKTPEPNASCDKSSTPSTISFSAESVPDDTFAGFFHRFQQPHRSISICYDINGKVSCWSRTAENILGYSAEQVVGKDISNLVIFYQNNKTIFDLM